MCGVCDARVDCVSHGVSSESAVGGAVMPRLRLCDRRQGRIRVLVAASAAVAQLGYRVQDSWCRYLHVRRGLERVAVAARAIRLERSGLPDDDFVVGRVTARALDAASVLLVRRRKVPIRGRRRPRRRAVAGSARLHAGEVTRRLAFGGCAVVAGRAGIWRDAGMRERRRYPRGGTVAGVAGCRRHQMPCGFSGCGGAVVTGRATSGHHAHVTRHRRTRPRELRTGTRRHEPRRDRGSRREVRCACDRRRRQLGWRCEHAHRWRGRGNAGRIQRRCGGRQRRRDDAPA